MVKSLVTGAAGFIGSNLVDYLLDHGHEIVAVDNETANNDKFYWRKDSRVQNVKANVSKYKEMRPLFDGVDYVFHLAAESRLQPAIDNPINAVKQNCVGTTVVLQCSREANVKRVIYSSTSSGYGGNPWPNKETQPDDCLNPYSASKIAGEKFCKMYTDLYGLETVSLRYFNVFGERSPSVGQYAPVISIFQRQAGCKDALTIVGDGSQKRDFVHVKDVARANYLAAIMPIYEMLGEVYNVGSGKNYSIQEIANAISDNQVYLPERSGEATTTLADISRIGEVIGWKPEIDVMDWIYDQR